MSGAYFQHTCPVTNTSTQRITRWTCKKCGQRALFAGCRSSMVESWGAYERRTGIAGFGPHRPFADQLLKEIDSGPCLACAGRGAIDPEADDYRLSCQSCDGSGRAPYPPADLARVQAQVATEWPPERIAEERRKQSERWQQARDNAPSVRRWLRLRFKSLLKLAQAATNWIRALLRKS